MNDKYEEQKLIESARHNHQHIVSLPVAIESRAFGYWEAVGGKFILLSRLGAFERYKEFALNL